MTKYNAGSQRRPRRRIMRALKINEISAVDRPAQEGALATLLKRVNGGDGVTQTGHEAGTAKRAALTTAVDGHSHLAYLDRGEGDLTAGATSYVDDHSHPWVRLADGSIAIGEAKGHTHGIAQVGKAVDLAGGGGDVSEQTEEEPMTDAEKKAAEDARKAAEARAEAAEKATKRLEAIVALKADERAHFEALATDADKDAFLAKSAAERTEVLKAKADANGVVYKSDAGVEYRKSDDPRLVELAKQADEDRRARKAAEAKTAEVELNKRAEELAHIPGTVADRAAMLKAIDSIPDEKQREAAHSALKAQNERMAKAFETHGSLNGAVEESSDEAELEKLARERAAEKKISYVKAYNEVLKTPRGQELYKAVRDASIVN